MADEPLGSQSRAAAQGSLPSTDGQIESESQADDEDPMTGAPNTGAPTASKLDEPAAGDQSAGEAKAEEDGKRQRNWKRFALEWFAVLVVAVGVAVLVRTFVVQTFYIPSASMEPTLMIGDRILVDKLSYHLHGVGRGDIVVFATPPGEITNPQVKDLVKRVIGLPGESISSSPDGSVLINGRPIAQPWLTPQARADPGPPIRFPDGTGSCAMHSSTIPPGCYFVMGDNRGDSEDSRAFGPISRSLIVGHVVFRIWPLSHMGFF